MTLRTRLLIGLLALAAVGLTVAGALVYRQQGNYLVERVDDQLNIAARNRALFFDEFRSDPTPIDNRGVPVGTYAKLLDKSGAVVKEIRTYDLVPMIPVERIGAATGDPFSVSSPHYRVLVQSVNIKSQFGREDPGTLVIAIPMRDIDDSLQRLLFVEIVVALGILVALAGLTWLMIKLGLRPLEQMQVTAGAIAAGDLSKRVEVVDETTEVGKLGLAMNEMMNRIEHAFDERAASEERLRRFVGDASHELRTPLTSIRGYAELFRRGAADRPEDLAKAMRRIEEEADRMGVLVDDLLLLARLDQGRPLERNPIDLTRIARDAVDDLRTVAPDRPVDFTAPAPVLVPGDDTRLRQVFANLLQNANRHTPPGTPVHVRVVTDGDNAVIEVADEGPGMEAADAQRVFERFWRSDPARTRASGGAGLGLSIVAAIAEAHGGRASVESTPGVGATFRVALPLHVDEEADSSPEPPTTPTTPAAVPAIPLAELEDATPSE